MPDDNNLLEKMNESYEEVKQSGSEEAYTKLSSTFEKMQSKLRDYGQKLALDEMKAVLQKLKNDEKAITDEDLKNLKSWIVGDAEYYIETNNNVDVLRAELEQLIGKIREIWADHPDEERLLKLRSLAREGVNKIAGIALYVKHKESVERFNVATKEIGESERVVLVSLLEQKISTSQF